MVGTTDAIDMGLVTTDSVGAKVVLPSSFTGGRRYNVMNYQNAMAICRVYGPPDLFVTFTCNTKWPEIIDALCFEPGQQPSDHFDLVVRVLHMKVDEFIVDIREGKTFGPILAVLYTVELKKRDLAHIHCLVWLAGSSSEFNSSIMDNFICAEDERDVDIPLLPPEVNSELIIGSGTLAKSPATPNESDNIIVSKAASASNVGKDLTTDFSTKIQKSTTRKRSRPFLNERTTKKLFLDEGIGDEDDEGYVDDIAKPSAGNA